MAAAIAAGVGYLLGATGGYGGATFDRHLQLGIVVAIGALITALAAWRRQRTGAGDAIVRVALALTLLALTAAGHLGATLTHGEDYLTEFAPALAADAAGRIGGDDDRLHRADRARARLRRAGPAGAAAPLRLVPRARARRAAASCSPRRRRS